MCSVIDWSGYSNGQFWIHTSSYYNPYAVMTGSYAACSSGSPVGGNWFNFNTGQVYTTAAWSNF